MLTDCLIALIILTILFSIVSISLKQTHSKSTLAGTLLLFHKLKAIDHKKYEIFSVLDGETQLNIKIPVNDCQLIFHPNGTAAKSGTCKGAELRFTLKPGESGIGYPW